MFKVGVVGCGHLGKIHIKLLNQSESFDLLEFMIMILTFLKSASEFGCKSYESFEEMIERLMSLILSHPHPSF